MDKKKLKGKAGPERIIQTALVKKLRFLEWYVKETHGNAYQSGVPDLFICHRLYGHRWIDVKNPKSYKFTPAQLLDWPLICANGSGVWILVAATDTEYEKLFKPCNWYQYTEGFR